MQGCLPCIKVGANARHFIKMARVAEPYAMPAIPRAELWMSWGKKEGRGSYHITLPLQSQ